MSASSLADDVEYVLLTQMHLLHPLNVSKQRVKKERVSRCSEPTKLDSLTD